MKVYRVLLHNEIYGEYNTLGEAIREAIITGSLKILTVDRPENRSQYSMSKFAPPEDYHWFHQADLGEQDGDGVVSTANHEAKRAHRRIRRDWLKQFPLSVSTEPHQGFRYWRWIDPSTEPPKVVWWERRPWDDPLPHEPGFWPDDGGAIS